MSYPCSYQAESTAYSNTFPYWILDNDTAVSKEVIAASCKALSGDSFYSASQLLSDPLVRFYELKARWETDTALLSSVSEICMHPAYQQIIGMGRVALPFIMRELTSMPDLWFWALKAITGEDPVPIDKRGRIHEMANEWLVWWTRSEHKTV